MTIIDFLKYNINDNLKQKMKAAILEDLNKMVVKDVNEPICGIGR